MDSVFHNAREIARREIRSGSVGTWYEVTEAYELRSGPGEDIELRLYPRALRAEGDYFAIEYNVRSGDGLGGWDRTGWYLEKPGDPDPRFLARGRIDAMREAEVIVAVLVTGGSTIELSGQQVGKQFRTCQHCGRSSEVTR